MRTSIAALLTAVLLPQPFALAEDAKPAPVPASDGENVTSVDVTPGDKWVYKEVNDITGDPVATVTYVVTELADNRVTALVTRDAGPDKIKSLPMVYGPGWSVVKSTLWQATKPDTTFGVQTPFKVGSKWQTKFDMTRSNPDVTLRVTTHSTVVGKEQITLPSGEVHQTYKIEAESIGAQVGTSNKTDTKATIWYDPTINRYVQRTSEVRNNGMLARKEREYLVTYSHRATG